ncbi:MAG: winged helix-turn-helix domain-containing protein, partial [Oscillospiraceae bacterium]|nr:winged helix-turn-helix domain-containing protein [Oscillospiraceae bacterium]
HYLMENSGCVVEHRQLMEEIWGKAYNEKDTDILWRTINRIRTKLSEIYPGNEYIRIERGVGYVFEP